MTRLPIIITCLFLLTSFISFSQDKGQELMWGERALKWIDFKGTPDNKSEFKAYTTSGMRYIPKYVGDSMHCEIITYFEYYKSWSVSQSEYLLEHEQIHFDITEYHARLFRKELSQHTFTSLSKVGSDLSEMLNRYTQSREKMQDLYDSETNHSKNQENQLKWNEKISDLLKSTEKFKSSLVLVYIGNIR